MIGSNASYNVLTVINGGLVSNVNGYIGYSDMEESYNTGVVNNATWINTGNLTVGSGDDHNSLIVQNTGVVRSVNGYIGAGGNNNSALVTDNGSLWDISGGTLMIGSNASYNILTVLNGGVVSNANGYIGYADIATSYNTGVVDNATWINTGNLTVGYGDDHNSLIVTNTGIVRSANGYVGVGSSGNYNDVLVTGSGSIWTNSNNLYIGYDGSVNSMTIANSGTVYNVHGTIGVNPGANNNAVLVTGSGSAWNNSADLNVGYLGSFNSLTVSNGGVVNNSGNGYVGGNYVADVGAGANSNTVLVTGSGAAWHNNGSWLFVGTYGAQFNSVTVSNEGLLTSHDTYLGYYANNNNILVTGTNSVWNNTGGIYVGLFNGNTNMLTISHGGIVSNNYAYIGWFADKNSALVTDPGSAWINSGDLIVGYAGQFNTLTVSNGGAVVATNVIVGTDAGSVGNLITITEGNLVVTNSPGGSVDVRNGALVFNSGDIWLNSLIIETNGTYSDTSAGALNLVNSDPTINIATGLSITVNSLITGTTGMIKTGAGELTLTHANIYSGPTFMNDGTLTVRNSNALGVGNLNLVGGTLRTGSELMPGVTGVLGVNVAGSYTQSVGGTLQLGVAGPVNRDWLNIVGNASLDGTLRTLQLNSWLPNPFDKVVLLVASNAVTGTFATFDNQIPASPLLITNLLYHTYDVTLAWAQLPFSPYALTPNQHAVAGALDATLTNTVMGPLFSYLDYLHNGTNGLPAAFDLIAPDELTAMFSIPFAGMDERGYSFLGRIQELRAGSHGFSATRLSLFDSRGPGQSVQRVCQTQSPIVAPCNDALSLSADNPWGVYLEGAGEFVNVRSDANASGYHLRSGGLTVGVDRRIGEEFAIGLTLGYANISADLVNDGRVDVDNGRASIYATWFKQGFHVEGMLIGGINSYDTRRTAIEGMARGSTDGTEWGGLIGGGYDWQKGMWIFGPQLTLQYKRVDIDSFTETGSLSPLQLLSQGQESMNSRLGMHLGCRAKAGKVLFAPELSLSWQHEYLNSSVAMDSRFANGAGNIFTVHGPDIGRDSMVIGLGIWVQWNPTVGTYINYNTELGRDGYEPHTFNGGVSFQF